MVRWIRSLAVAAASFFIDRLRWSVLSIGIHCSTIAPATSILDRVEVVFKSSGNPESSPSVRRCASTTLVGLSSGSPPNKYSSEAFGRPLLFEVGAGEQGYAKRVWQRNDFYGTASKEETQIVKAGASTRDQSVRRAVSRKRGPQPARLRRSCPCSHGWTTCDGCIPTR